MPHCSPHSHIKYLYVFPSGKGSIAQPPVRKPILILYSFLTVRPPSKFTYPGNASHPISHAGCMYSLHLSIPFILGTLPSL